MNLCLQGLFKALNVLDEQYGRIHIDFTTPIMASKFFGDLRSPKLLRPLHLQVSFNYPLTPHSLLTKLVHFQHELSSDESTRIIWLANHVVRQQQQNAVISLFSLAAVFVAMHALTKPKSPSMSFQQLQQKVAVLKRVVESLGALVDCPSECSK